MKKKCLLEHQNKERAILKEKFEQTDCLIIFTVKVKYSIYNLRYKKEFE